MGDLTYTPIYKDKNNYVTDPPTYSESISGAVNLWDNDDDDTDSPEENMGDLTYTTI